MRKYLLHLMGITLLFSATASPVLGLSLNDFRDQVFRPGNLPGAKAGNLSAESKVISIIDFLISLIIYASGSVAVLMLIYGGIRLITATGNTEQKEQATKIIRWSGSGLIVVILAYALVSNVITLIFRATT